MILFSCCSNPANVSLTGVCVFFFLIFVDIIQARGKFNIASEHDTLAEKQIPLLQYDK